MLNLTDGQLSRYIKKDQIYTRGLAYVFQRKVHNFQWNKESLTVSAGVMGSLDYRVKIVFNSDSTIQAYGCDCPFLTPNSGMCKHLVAVYRTAQSFFQQELLRQQKANEAVSDVLDYFSAYADMQRVPVNISVIYEIEKDYDHPKHSFSLKIGESKQYVVKNLYNFFESIQAMTPTTFGKGFTFDPSFHYFKDEDMPIIHLIHEAIAADHIVTANVRYYVSRAFLSGKSCLLSDYTVKKLFQILQTRSFDAKIFDQSYAQVSILESDMPVSFLLSKNNENNLLLQLDNFHFIPLTTDCEYIFANGKILHQQKETAKHLQPFIRFVQKSGNNTMVFSGAAKDRFIQDALPHMNQDLPLSIAENVQDTFVKEPLRCEIYFDKEEKQITCRVFFHYGTYKITAFETAPSVGNTIIIRDAAKEKEIMSALERADFHVAKGYLFMEDDEKIFDFLMETLPFIQPLAQVYYSDSFKNLRLSDTRKFKAGVRYTEGAKMFEITFDFDNIDKQEVRDILASYRLKKKYHRLKSGDFIALDQHDMKTVDDLITFADIHERNLSETVKIPISRALYVNNQLQNSDGIELENDFSFQTLVDDIKNAPNMEYNVPEALDDILRDYQKTGFKWFKTLSHYKLGGILADDMGLGKTLQAITFIVSEKEKTKKPSLVVAPTSLLYNWQDEIHKFAPYLRVLLITGAVHTRQGLFTDIGEADIVVTSYPLIRRDIALYESIEFAYCFLDEAQHIKNPESINAKSVKQIQADGYFALTGTPIENSLTEMWSIFDFVMPGFLLSHHKFVSKYERPIVKDNSQEAMEHLSKQIRPFVMRRMKRDVLKELPEKIETKMTAELTEEQKKIYLAYLEQINAELLESKRSAPAGHHAVDDNRIKILSYLTRLRQICCHPATFLEDYTGESGKLQLLQEIVSDALASKHRILLFSQFTSMLALIKNMFNQENIQYFYLDGQTKIEDRRQMVHDFNDGEKQVFLISLKAGGTGLNLTGADMVIHYDPWWNPAVEDQATDRAYRIGQENVVQVMKLVTKGTIEEKIYKLQEKKKQIMDAVIQPGETFISKMSAEELESLFAL